MSQPDLLAQLREARPIAPGELRERIRTLAAEAKPEPRRRLNWRRAFVVAVPVAAAAAVAAVALVPGSGSPKIAQRQLVPAEPIPVTPKTVLRYASGGPAAAAGVAVSTDTALPAPSPGRTQRIAAGLQLRVPDTQAVSDDTKQAVQIARSLGGFPRSLDVDASGRTGYATIVLRIPKPNVQKAVSRLSALGTIVGEDVTIHDIQGQVDSTARKIGRLNHALAALKGQYQDPETVKKISGLDAEIGHLKRGQAATIHTASYATVSLGLTTRAAPAAAKPQGPGPLHGLKVAFHWAWIGAIYFGALGLPVLLVLAFVWWIGRLARRRGEERLLATR